MPLDAVCISGLAYELNNDISEMKIDKVQQPEKNVFILSLRGARGSSKLLISSGSGSARVHITKINRENPQTPPMFCMLLRKHLTGAKILSVTQPLAERMIDIELSAYDEMGVSVRRHLICEMLGKHPNLILTDEENRIIDCFRKIDADMSEKRQLLPGMFYHLPPKPDKPELLYCSEEEFTAVLAAAPGERSADKWLVESFCGISPLGAREMACAASGNASVKLNELSREDLVSVRNAFAEAVKEKRFTPCMLSDGDKPKDIYCFWVKQYENAYRIRSFDSFSELLDEFYTERERLEHVAQRGQAIQKTVKNLRDRTARKLAVQTEELKATFDRERFREYGDIIKANLYRMERGAKSLTAQNFYSEECEDIEIPLEPKLSPQQNAAKYYKQYNKAKNAEKYLTEQIENAEKELEYFESVLEELSRADGMKDISDIRRELTETGYIREQNKKRMKTPESRPMEFVSRSGVKIYCGRNNLQNDKLTLKEAYRGDTWLHTQKIHGSHVIISTMGEEPDPETLEDAACIAAFYSKGRGGSKIPVDYTKVKYVKKPSGAKPGMVIYTDYKTIYVTPDEERINAMKV
ncbi:MAG: NFACT RNA binding domain-containing protein [Clostridiales bacterium]|nr:NFACT RNA binding domain-containing protein [Clostridiales bacterium]